MSHFVVIVFGENWEEQLAPYQENNMGDCPREFLEFEDMTGDLQDDYENNTATRVVFPDGSMIDPHDREYYEIYFRVDPMDTSPFPRPSLSIPPGMDAEIKEIPVKELFSFEEFCQRSGYETDEDGNYGYMQNPNSKWDWYQPGGRWTGYFKLKEGHSGSLGKPGVLTDPAEKGFADQCLKRDVDIESMRNDAAERAADQWDRFHGALGDVKFIPWEHFREKYKDIEEARQKYREQDAMVILRKYEAKNERQMEFTWEPEKFIESRGDFIQSAKNQTLVPFAFVIDGKWNEKGNMGWWGIVIDGKEPDDWNKEFQKFFDDLPDDMLMTAVDCHI